MTWLRLNDWRAINLAHVAEIECSRVIDQGTIYFRGGRKRQVNGAAAQRLRKWFDELGPLEDQEPAEILRAIVTRLN